jgi:Holliday junction DNA helicase RuvA
MIVALRGRLAGWEPNISSAWLDVQGVTYEVLVPAFLREWMDAQPLGDELRLYTYYHVAERNPSPVLIGFRHHAEREFFRKFIEVPDVGPAKAVKALTRPVSEIAGWIEAEDVRALQQLPGIGARLSQTIVARLAGRLTEAALLRDQRFPGLGTPSVPADDLREDAVAALTALQYSAREADQMVVTALRARPDIETLEDLLRAVLARSFASSSTEAAPSIHGDGSA